MNFASIATVLLLLTAIIFSMAAKQHINPEGVFARLNYGVIFRPVKPIRIVTDEWTHVYVIKLPERYPNSDHIRRIRNFNCSNIKGLAESSCKSYRPLFDSLVRLHETSFRRVHRVIEHMYQVLPDDLSFRPRRGLFDLGGKILNSLFGVATTEQVDAIRAAAQHTMNDNANAFQRWQKITETMSSFMTVVNHRLNNFANILRDHLSLIHI